MAHRIEIGLKPGLRDARGSGVMVKAKSFLGLDLAACLTRDIYKVDAALSGREAEQVLRALADPVVAEGAAGRLPPPAFDWMIEVGFKPGVTDNVGRTARSLIEDVLDRKLGEFEEVYTSVQYFLSGARLARADAERLASQLLANTLIQTVAIFDAGAWAAQAVDQNVPAIRDAAEAEVRTYDLSGTDEELMAISSRGILSLSLREMHCIRDHFARPEVQAERQRVGLPGPITDVELECIAQTWSEHCKHKIFSALVEYEDEHGHRQRIDSLFRTYIKEATAVVGRRVPWLVSVFSDNAGIIRFDQRFHVLFKVETHNSPSALDPYGGAITGIVGVNRDAMGTGLGGEMLCNTWGYCLGSPFYGGDLPAGLMHPRRIRDGVHQGVIDGGNQSGIPWMRGFERFDDRFIGKPLVFCGTVGRIPVQVAGRPSEEKRVEAGDVIVMAGGRIGKDGIHGATFSSEELRSESPAQAVQIGDPITQRKMYEFLLEARDRNLFRAITDNGAGGLSSSIGEMCRLSGGAELDLAQAPLKYTGLQPWEIFLSEAQERMSLAVPPACLREFLELARRRDVEATALGVFTDSGRLLVKYGPRVVASLDMEFLHDGCPRMTIPAKWTPPRLPAPKPLRGGLRNKALRELLASLNVASKEHKSRMYDGEVKGLSVVKPFVGVYADVPSDATVMRVHYESDECIALSEGINPHFSDLDAYHMAASVVDEAVRRILSVGGQLGHIAALDNFCWPDPVLSEKTPDGPYKMAQLVRANRALYDVCTAYNVPLISGKDSMKNDSTRGGRKISIPPTLLISAIGKIRQANASVTMPFKRPGDHVYVLGLTRAELGGSEFHRWLALQPGQAGRVGGEVPKVFLAESTAIYGALQKAHHAALLRSCHTPTLGGLAVAMALAALGGDLGADLMLQAAPRERDVSNDELLFSESNSRFLITCSPPKARDLEAAFRDLPFARIGTVRKDQALRVTGLDGQLVIEDDLRALRPAFKGTLRGL